MAWKDRDEKLADEKQQRVVAAADFICGRLGIPGVKFACDLNGYYGGLPRLPLLPLTAAERDEVQHLLVNIRQ
jgi:dihydrodipicolinate synthase/N-acetylneuraminate lyase